MKTNNITRLILSGALVVALASCDDFLNVQPDNRTTIDTDDKAVSMLVSAYSTSQPWMFLELMSDNADDHRQYNQGLDDLYARELYEWQDPTQEDNTSPKNTWDGQFGAIASANQALLALEKLDKNEKTLAARGEALICRAYAHFVLVNIFGQHYDPQHPEDLGIPYMDKVETELNPQYERNTVHEVYALIEKDIEEGLPLISDANYSVPSYHFNSRAANAFAARFYLYYQKWEKAIACATAAVSTNPQSVLRDYEHLLSLPFSTLGDIWDVAEYYSGTKPQCNFLIGTAYSDAGVRYTHPSAYGQYTFSDLIDVTEGTRRLDYPYFPASLTSFSGGWKRYTVSFNGMDKNILPRVSYLFEYIDQVAGIGYSHATYPLFTADETLLTRAEAYIMMQNYDAALADMNLYAKNACVNARTMTTDLITSWANKLAYYEPTAPTPKKVLHPAFALDPTQEAFVHVLLAMRRYETLHFGLRWFDVKRFGIEIYRRELTSDFTAVSNITDKLDARDPRRALQLPADVISAGLEPNPR